MKIFSNFDTELAKILFKEAAERYGNDYVLCVRRAKVYLLIRLFPPIMFRLIFCLGLLFFYYILIGVNFFLSEVVGFFVRGLIASTSLYMMYYILTKMMNYYMDFVIITPDQLVSYNQEGVLTRTTRSLELRKIKTVNVVTDGWLSSLFGYGSIVFLAEGDNLNGDIKLNFIVKPVQLRNNIYSLIDHRTTLNEDDGSSRKVYNNDDDE